MTITRGKTLPAPSESPLAGKRCLVTGGGGFIGSHLIRELMAAGAEPIALVSEVSLLCPPRLSDIRRDVRIVGGNVADGTAMRILMNEISPQVIFHLAAFTHVGRSFTRVDECISTNAQGTVNLILALEPGSYDCFVYTSTSEIYGDVDVPFTEDGPVNPISPYSISKYMGERFARMYCDAYDWPIVCVRPFNAYGPFQTPDRVVPEIITSALSGRDVEMTKGTQTREFNYVTDIARGFIAAAAAGEGAYGQVINIGCGDEISMVDLATKILGLMGDPVKALPGALPHRPTEIWRMYCDSSRAAELLGWAPEVSLDEGLARTIDWYRAEFDRGDSLFVP